MSRPMLSGGMQRRILWVYQRETIENKIHSVPLSTLFDCNRDGCVFDFNCSGIKFGVALSSAETEYLSVRFPILTLLYALYSVKLKKLQKRNNKQLTLLINPVT